MSNSITCKKRTTNGFITRKTNYVPACIYGEKIKNAHSIMIDSHEIHQLTKKLGKFIHSTIIQVQIEGEEYKCIIKDITYHPVKQEILNIDFQSIDTKDFVTYVPIIVINKEKCEALKAKSAIWMPKKLVQIKTNLKNFIDKIEIDVQDFKKQDKKFAHDFPNIHFVHSKNNLLMSIK